MCLVETLNKRLEFALPHHLETLKLSSVLPSKQPELVGHLKVPELSSDNSQTVTRCSWHLLCARRFA